MHQELEITTCRELLGFWRKEQAGIQTIKGLRVDIHEFEQLLGPGREIISRLAKRALDNSTCKPENSFEPFIFGWIALNSWASCVTGSEKDSEFLRPLALDQDLRRRFDKQFDAGESQRVAEEFRVFWPILRPLPIRQIPDDGATRDDLILRELSRRWEKPRSRPECAARHCDNREEIPLDWPHTFSAIYQVRCNLFHGSKSLYSDIDTQIVCSAFRVLVRILPILGL
jgi:hypothetical protein